MKICRYCNKELPINKFGNDKRSKDGKKNKCSSCHNEYMKAYYWQHREVLAARVLVYHYKNREIANKKRKLNRLKNLEKQMQHSRQWQKDNPELANAIKTNWRMKNRVKLKAIADKRNIIVKNGNVPSSFIKMLKTQPCNYCGIYVENQMQIDHVIPIAKGGQHSVENLVSACKSCNLSKSDKMLDVWILTR